LGPDQSDPILRYVNIATGPQEAFAGDFNIDLLVSASDGYANPRPDRNGINGDFGSITQECATYSTFTFSFVKSGTTEPVKMDSFMFTIFDLDHGAAGGQAGDNEIVSVASTHGLTGYFLPSNTELDVTCSGSLNTFRSTSRGSRDDNPVDPLFLQPLQKARSATLKYEHTSSFSLEFNIKGGGSGFTRSFLFGGNSDFACFQGQDANGNTTPLTDPCSSI